MSAPRLAPEDYPQFGIMVHDLPDPGASLDADMAGDPGSDACEVEERSVDAVESESVRRGREHEEMLAPYLAKYLPSIDEYERRVVAMYAEIESSEDLSARGARLAKQAAEMRQDDESLARYYAEQNLREAQLLDSMKATREGSASGGGEKR